MEFPQLFLPMQHIKTLGFSSTIYELKDYLVPAIYELKDYPVQQSMN